MFKTELPEDKPTWQVTGYAKCQALEARIARLEEALKPFADAFVERERLYKKGTVEAIWKLVDTNDYEAAHQALTEDK